MPSDVRHPGRTAAELLKWFAGALVACLFITPILWALSASLRSTGQPWARDPEWIPSPLAWENYTAVFDAVNAARFAINSLIIVVFATPLTILFASLAGFAISQLSRRWRTRFLLLSVGCLMVPITAIWLPRFILYKESGLIDTRFVLIVPSLMGTSPLYVMLFVWAFLRIPRDHIDAAKLDGAGAFRIWGEIGLPLARPAIVAVGVLSAVHYWNAFIEPLLYIRTIDKYVASQGLRMLYQFDSTNWPLIMAGSILMIAPIIALFTLAQRVFLQDRRGQSILAR
ncbi:MAG: carbohydrate ABC transporter permease [Thermomicrobiales bacterium]